MFNAVVDSVSSGCVNFIDTAINFRYQKSERVVGAALAYLKDAHRISRDEVFIHTKGGLVHEDADLSVDGPTLIRQLTANGVIGDEDVFEGSCLEPEFLKHQIQKSRRNLGVETIDAYSLNLPEVWLARLPREAFFQKLMVG